MRALLAGAALIACTGCFSGARPIKQMAAGDIMIGTNLNLPGAVGDPELTAWFRFAPYGSMDITAGAHVGIPIAAHLPGVGGLAEIRQHVPLATGWRLVLDASGEVYRAQFRDDRWTTHYRLSFVPYFVVDTDLFTMFFGPKAGWLTGVREITTPMGADPIRPVAGAPGFVFVGGSIGAEDPNPPWFFTSIGGAFDVGSVIDADTGESAVPVSYSMSIYFGFL